MKKSQIRRVRDVYLCVVYACVFVYGACMCMFVFVCGICMCTLLDVCTLHVLLQDFISVGLGRPHTDKALFEQRPNCRERQTKALWGKRIQVEKTTNNKSLRSEQT